MRAERLEAIMSLARQLHKTDRWIAPIAADIGCDHGMVSAELVIRGYASKVFAVDISPVSAKKAQKYATLRGLDSSKVDVRLGDGFAALKNERIDYAVITGLGGYKIIKILEELPASCQGLILGPQKDAYALRKYLITKGFGIRSDFTVKDDRYYYDIIGAESGGQFVEIGEQELLHGHTDISCPSQVFVERLAKERSRLMRIKDTIPSTEEVSNLRRLEIIEKILKSKRPL